MSRLLTVEGLEVGFGSDAADDRVVHGISFTVDRGEAVAIVGESGSGKSVTARSLVGLAGAGAHVHARRLELDGDDLLAYREGRWRTVRGRRVGLVLQDALVSFDPVRTVGAELDDVLVRHAPAPRARRRERAAALLREAGIPDPEARLDQLPHELSGGLRQRALIASALAGDPDLIVADEPTTALDVTVQAQVLALLRRLVDDGRSLLLISHDLAAVAGVADRILVMKDGAIVEQGPARQVLTDPQHPYTRALLAAVPSGASRGRRLAGGERSRYASRIGRAWRSDRAPEVVVEARGLVRTFAGRDGSVRRAVDDVSFELHRGETLGIVGESGSGKSTVARLLLGLDRPDAGRVAVDGRAWSDLSRSERRALRRRVQAVSQDALGTFDPRHDVGRILAEALRATDDGERPSARDMRARSVELLELVGLGEQHLARHPLRLSGGQRQRVAIARALAPRPDVLVCDEPVSALDVSVQAQVLDLLADVREATGVASVFISHDLGVVHHVADRVLVLKDGRAVEAGDADAVFHRPQHAYTRELLAAVPRVDVPV
ncbi:dipeptide ABC transporter ATP-binding protein [Puerhibacterium puerhi]|uniref:dipeptide ABC transporter ATP-binding protein n=1 Tax=Puerhibacterium puerhi TaxID=2692623 RepID=UPI001356C497|nr:ABC transporter ATP-binding protein [Puerhibacterium puerhi]